MDTRFYLADDIQHMPDGKILAVGLYGDATLVVPVNSDAEPGDRPRALARLCIMVSLTNMPTGKHKVQPSVIFPDGKAAPQIDAVALEGAREVSANLLCRFAPFPVPQFGTYKFTVTMGKQSTTHEFFIRGAKVVKAPAARKVKAAVPAPSAKKATAKSAKRASH